MWKISVCITILVLSSVTARHISIFGPLISTGGDTYKAFVSAAGFPRNAELAILINCNGYMDKKIFTLGDDGFEATAIEFKMPQVELGACQLYSVVKQGNYCTKDEIYFQNKLDNFLLIQTDKPVYKPGDKLSYQIIALDSETKPVPFKNIGIQLFDSKNNLVLSTNSTTDKTKEIFGFYQSEIFLSNEPNLGTWTLKATIDELNTTLSQNFQVNYYNLPPFKVYVETNSKISYDESHLNLNLYAKYSFDKFVKGMATVTATVRPQSKPNVILSTYKKTIDITDKTPFKINLKEDLSIKFMVKSVVVSLEVEFEEANTEVKSVETRQVLIFPTGKHIINVDTKDKFRPGFPFKINVAVTTFDGRPESSESIPITVGQKYEYEGGQYGKNAEITSASFLKNGLAQFIIHPAENAKSLELTVKYDQSKVVDKISRIEHSSTDEFLQALVLAENPRIDDIIDINVRCNSIPDDLNVVVFSKSGIVYTNTFKDIEDVSNTNISFKITKEMAPVANVVIFYLRESDGVMIFDQIELNLGFLSSNFISLDTSDKPQKIRQNVQIDVTTQPHSLVGLLAVDQSVAFMGRNNLVSHDYVASKLYPDSSTYPYKKDNKRFVFGNINAFKISPTNEKRRACLGEELRLFNSFDVAVVEGFEWNDDGPTFEIGTTEEVTRKNFPEVWFQEVQEVEDGSYIFLKTLPDSITTWIINGFSISPEHGFSVSDPARIYVFQNFFIRVERPQIAKLQEIVSIKVIVHNYLKNNVHTTVTLKNSKNMFEFYEKNKFKKILSKTLPTQVKFQDTAVVIFKVRAVEVGKVEFEINAKTTTNAEDTIIESFTVNAPGVTKTLSRSIVLDLNNKTSLTDEMTFEIPEAESNSVSFEVVATGDLLGPALDNVEELIKVPEGCGEQKMRIISSAIMAVKYLEATSQLTNKDKKKFGDILMKSYQNLIALQNEDGSFDLWGTSHLADRWKQVKNHFKVKDYLDLTAYIVKLLIQYDSIQPIPDKNVITKAVKYIESKQNENGSFESREGAQFRDLQMYSNIDGVSLTAYILIGFLENDNLNTSYSQVVAKALNFIESKHDDVLHDGTNYERALILYVYALAGKDHQRMFNKLKEKAIQFDGKLYWNLNGQTESSAAVQVEISSYVVLALTKLKHYEEANEIVKFLMTKKNPLGGFSSSTDTVLGLQALAEISKILYSKDTNINLRLKNQLDQEVFMNIKKVQKRSPPTVLPPSTRNITINAKGYGVASLQVSCAYKQKLKSHKIFFDLNVNVARSRDNNLMLEVCVKTKRSGHKSNMAVVEIEMPSGYTHRQGPGPDHSRIKKIERLNGGVKVLIYLSEVDTNEICLSEIEAVQTAKVEKLQNAEVKVFDYYEPERLAFEFFKLY